MTDSTIQTATKINGNSYPETETFPANPSLAFSLLLQSHNFIAVLAPSLP